MTHCYKHCYIKFLSHLIYILNEKKNNLSWQMWNSLKMVKIIMLSSRYTCITPFLPSLPCLPLNKHYSLPHSFLYWLDCFKYPVWFLSHGMPFSNTSIQQTSIDPPRPNSSVFPVIQPSLTFQAWLITLSRDANLCDLILLEHVLNTI